MSTRLDVQELDARIFTALGIRGRAGFRPFLRDDVLITVQVPLGVGAAESLGFNDSETDAGNAFVGFATTGPVAGQFSHVQAKNPAGSGRLFYLDHVVIVGQSVTRGLMMRGAYDTDLTTPVGAMTNRLVGGNSSATLLKSQENAGLLGALMEYRGSTAGQDVVFSFNPPLRLNEGKAVLLGCDTVNLSVGASFHGREYTA